MPDKPNHRLLKELKEDKTWMDGIIKQFGVTIIHMDHNVIKFKVKDKNSEAVEAFI